MADGSTLIFLSKIATQSLSPLALCLGLLLASAGLSLAGRNALSRFVFVMAVAGLWIVSLPPVGRWALSTLEQQYPLRTIAETPPADVAILLGGAVLGPTPPRVEAELNEAGDRVLHAARLYRAGKVRRILVSGGNIPWISNGVPEAEYIREYLVEMGVPVDAIEIAGQSRNTAENAREIVALWTRGQFNSALLVTSAAHMPRALAIFKNAGLPVIPSSTDVRGTFPAAFTVLDLLPDSEALDQTTRAMKEWAGRAAFEIGVQR